MIKDKDKKIEVYELTIEDINLENITAISLVDFPAVESNFIAFNESNKIQMSTIDKDKQVVTGVALIPDKRIYRVDNKGYEFEVFFSAETISKLAMDFIQNHRQNSITLDHASAATSVFVFESWIVENSENDKSNAIGLGKLPVGTWCISMKVNNKEVWEQIKDGELQGFSIEGYLSHVLTNLTKTNESDTTDITDPEIEIEAVAVLQKIKDLFEVK